jgi:hypothetical protein
MASRIPHPNITKIPETEPDAVPELWNSTYREIDENFVDLDERTTGVEDEIAGARQGKTSLGEAIAQIVQQVGGISDDLISLASPASIQKAVGLDWLYRGRRIAIELFAEGYSIQGLDDVNVISGVMGDDSLDIEDTAGVKSGQDYFISDGESVALVRVKDVLSSTRLRLTTNLSQNWGAGAVLTGSTLSDRVGGGVSAEVGGVWASSVINLGTDNLSRAVVIRRTLNAGAVKLFYRDANTDWTESFWSVRRAGGGTTGVPEGFADYEYLIPMRGDGYLRIEVEGEALEILHIAGLGGTTGLGGYVNPEMRPGAPVVMNPADAAIDVGERPTLTVTDFTSPAGNALAATQFQLSTASSFSSILHDSGDVSGMSYALPAGVLAAGAVYYLRARFKDAAGLVSDWCTVTSFTTKASFAYVDTPQIISPTNGQLDIPEQPTLQSGAFAAVGGEDTHAGSQWRIRLATGSWTAPEYDSGEVTDKNSHTLPAGVLQAGQTQYVLQVRHKGTTLGWSEWSQEISFVTKELFAQIIGIVQTATGGGAGSWQRVDEGFSALTTTSATFNNHPVYAAIVDQTVDSQAMVKVPKFYFRTGLVPSGPYTGKRYWMISDQPAEGFDLHPAFMNAGSEIAQFWVGKYQGTNDGGSKLGSAASVKPLVSIDFPTMQARAAARNVTGVSGFMLWSIYQLAAIQTLALIEMGGSDSQSLIGQGHVSGSSALNTNDATVAQATWRGIVGLWGNVWQMVDGLGTDGSSRYKIWDKNGNKSYLSTNKTIPASGYPITMETEIGADYDMGAVFAAASTDTTAGNGSFADYHYSNGADKVAYHGGHWGNGASAGLFILFVSNAASHSSTYLGGRLAKV